MSPNCKKNEFTTKDFDSINDFSSGFLDSTVGKKEDEFLEKQTVRKGNRRIKNSLTGA